MSQMNEANGEKTCDKSIALLMDKSGSMSQANMRLQVEATADALMHDNIVALIETYGPVAFSTSFFDAQLIEYQYFTKLHTKEEIIAFANQLKQSDSKPVGNTDIVGAVQTAARSFAYSPCQGKKVIDISTDGEHSPGQMAVSDEMRRAILASVRDQMVRADIRVNGIAVEGQVSNVITTTKSDAFYDLENFLVTRENGGFAIESTWKNYREAIRIKLEAELLALIEGDVEMITTPPPRAINQEPVSYRR